MNRPSSVKWFGSSWRTRKSRSFCFERNRVRTDIDLCRPRVRQQQLLLVAPSSSCHPQHTKWRWWDTSKKRHGIMHCLRDFPFLRLSEEVLTKEETKRYKKPNRSAVSLWQMNGWDSLQKARRKQSDESFGLTVRRRQFHCKSSTVSIWGSHRVSLDHSRDCRQLSWTTVDPYSHSLDRSSCLVATDHDRSDLISDRSVDRAVQSDGIVVTIDDERESIVLNCIDRPDKHRTRRYLPLVRCQREYRSFPLEGNAKQMDSVVVAL